MAGAAFVAWVAASLIVLADARRGLALGLGLLSISLAVLTWPAGMVIGSGAIVVGGLIAAVQCWRSGPAGWGIMPAGSTPRLILCVASALLAFWLAASVTTGPDASLRFAALVVPALMGARILMSRDVTVALAGIAAMAMALGTASGLDAESAGPIPAIVAGLIAAGVMFVPAVPISPSTAAPPARSAKQDGA
ncbi:MAG TPA: hypothetical protein VKF16_13020 [Candidatus Dormibacteraeota bacterium]|nr:hypothetical protein [Candidatus Dormibacteraeota bacterium]